MIIRKHFESVFLKPCGKNTCGFESTEEYCNKIWEKVRINVPVKTIYIKIINKILENLDIDKAK